MLGKRRRCWRVWVGSLGAIGQGGDGTNRVGSHGDVQHTVLNRQRALIDKYGIAGRAPHVHRIDRADGSLEVKGKVLGPEVGVGDIALASTCAQQCLVNHHKRARWQCG